MFLYSLLTRVLEIAVSCLGGCIGFFCGNMSTLTDDIQALKPSVLAGYFFLSLFTFCMFIFFIGVPRVFSKTYSKINAQLIQQPFYKKWIFNMFFFFFFLILFYFICFKCIQSQIIKS
jgi:long-subunit acyl-CoA synthetase (AMP-forming)